MTDFRYVVVAHIALVITLTIGKAIDEFNSSFCNFSALFID